MKFRNELKDYIDIKIGKEYHHLIICEKCETITAKHPNNPIIDVDKKIKCCKNPYYIYAYKTDKYIQQFIKKYEDKTK